LTPPLPGAGAALPPHDLDQHHTRLRQIQAELDILDQPASPATTATPPGAAPARVRPAGPPAGATSGHTQPAAVMPTDPAPCLARNAAASRVERSGTFWLARVLR
jgi:hypothetical protein